MKNILALLPRKTKKTIRVFHRILIAIWRRYPISFQRQIGSPSEGDQQFNSQYMWHKSLTPIPVRGNEYIQQNRIHNLDQAINSLNNLLIAPNQTFSLVSMIGETSAANGYREGPVFIDGSVSSGVGGGLCLIATNLYQLFLYCGCKIIERHNHSIDAYGNERFYVLGEDAAISSTYKDLVIKNPFNFSLHLQIRISGEFVESTLHCTRESPLKVHIESVVVDKKFPNTHQKNVGWTVYTMRFIRRNNSTRWVNDYSSFSIYAPS